MQSLAPGCHSNLTAPSQEMARTHHCLCDETTFSVWCEWGLRLANGFAGNVESPPGQYVQQTRESMTVEANPLPSTGFARRDECLSRTTRSETGNHRERERTAANPVLSQHQSLDALALRVRICGGITTVRVLPDLGVSIRRRGAGSLPLRCVTPLPTAMIAGL